VVKKALEICICSTVDHCQWLWNFEFPFDVNFRFIFVFVKIKNKRTKPDISSTPQRHGTVTGN